MKAVASICVLAHAGCFVPADFASICLTNRIIVRTTSNDSIEDNCSTFSKEMRQTASVLCCLEEMEAKYHQQKIILQQPSSHHKPSLLVIFDELARATSPMEGFSIAFAIAEQLVASPVAYCLFSTHFQEMSLFEEWYACAKSFYLTVEQHPKQPQAPPHALVRGFIHETTNYGITCFFIIASRVPIRRHLHGRKTCGQLYPKICALFSIQQQQLHRTANNTVQKRIFTRSKAHRIEKRRTRQGTVATKTWTTPTSRTILHFIISRQGRRRRRGGGWWKNKT